MDIKNINRKWIIKKNHKLNNDNYEWKPLILRKKSKFKNYP